MLGVAHFRQPAMICSSLNWMNAMPCQAVYGTLCTGGTSCDIAFYCDGAAKCNSYPRLL